MTISDINRVPPAFCRLVARKHRGHRMMSHSDIAKASGLARSTVVNLTYETKWDNYPLRTIVKFSQACGVNLLAPHHARGFLRWKRKVYLKNATPAQLLMVRRIVEVMSQIKHSPPASDAR